MPHPTFIVRSGPLPLWGFELIAETPIETSADSGEFTPMGNYSGELYDLFVESLQDYMGRHGPVSLSKTQTLNSVRQLFHMLDPNLWEYDEMNTEAIETVKTPELPSTVIP